MKTIKYKNINVPIIDNIPAGFVVWNIGNNAPAGYILICKTCGYNVIMETLRALPVSDHEKNIIDHACSYGAGNLQQARRKLQQYKTNTRAITRINAALPVLEKYCT